MLTGTNAAGQHALLYKNNGRSLQRKKHAAQFVVDGKASGRRNLKTVNLSELKGKLVVDRAQKLKGKSKPCGWCGDDIKTGQQNRHVAIDRSYWKVHCSNKKPCDHLFVRWAKVKYRCAAIITA